MASVWPLYHKGLNGCVPQRWLSFLKVLPSPQRNSAAVRVTIGFLLISLTKALLHLLLSLAGQPALGRVLVVPNFFHLRMMEATVLGDLQCCRNVLIPFPRSMPQHNLVLGLYGQLLRHHGLVFALTCTVNCVTLYRQACNPNPELIFESHSKGSEYLCK